MGVAGGVVNVIRGVASALGILSLKLVWKSWSLCEWSQQYVIARVDSLLRVHVELHTTAFR